MECALQLTENEIIQRYLDLYNTFDIEKMVDLFADDCLFQNINNSSGSIECRGKEALYKMAMQSATYFSMRSQRVTNWIISRDKIAVEIEYNATVARDLPNGLKKGEAIRMNGVSIFEFCEGKIKRLADFS